MTSVAEEGNGLAYNTREKVKHEIVEFNELKHTIKLLKTPDVQQNGLKAAVNIGQDFYIDAHVNDVSKILVNIGANIFVECPLDEALVLISKKQELLDHHIEHLNSKIAQIESLITLDMSSKSLDAVACPINEEATGNITTPTLELPGTLAVDKAAQTSKQLIETVQTLLALNLKA